MFTNQVFFVLDSCHVTVRDDVDAVCAQSKGKSTGPNGLFIEFLSMRVLTCGYTLILFFFTACIKRCFLPVSFVGVIIAPLVKN